MFRPLKAALLASAVAIAASSAVLATGSSAQAATPASTFCNTSSDYRYEAYFPARFLSTSIVLPGKCLTYRFPNPGERYEFTIRKPSDPSRPKVLAGFRVFACSSTVTLGGTFATPTYKHTCQ